MFKCRAGRTRPRSCGFAIVLLIALMSGRAACAPPSSCSPSPVGSTCGGGGPASLGNNSGTDQGAGNPINILTGNKYQREVDMAALPGDLGIEVVRHYNSLDRSRGSLSVGWRFSYETELVLLRDSVQISQADGGRVSFPRRARSPSLCFTDDPANGRLIINDPATKRPRYVWVWPNGRRLAFNADGKLEEIADGHGGLLTLTRGTRGELIAVSDSLGRQLTFQYEQGGGLWVSAVRTPLGVIHYAYEGDADSPRRNLVSARMTDGTTVRRYHYESVHQAGNRHAMTGISVGSLGPGSTVLAEQRLSTYAYDATGHGIWSMRGAGLERVALARSTTMGAVDRPATAVLINANGQRTRYRFAVIGGSFRLLSVEGPGCAHCGPGNTRYRYDAWGRVVSVEVDATGDTPAQWKRFDRDVSGRITRIRMPSVLPGKMRELQYLYDDAKSPAGLPVAMIQSGFSTAGPLRRRVDFSFDQQGRMTSRGATRFYYDDRGRMARQVDRDGAVTRYEYDALSRASRVRMADGRVAGYQYDVRGRIRAIDLDGRTERYEYDLNGRLMRVVRPNGERLDYRYDAADRVSRIVDANGNSIAFERDAEGELVRRQLFDAAGVLAQVREDRLPEISGDAAIAFDVGLRPVSMAGEDGAAGGYEYDDFGRLSSVRTASGGITSFEYDAEDRLIAKHLPSGVSIRYRYDATGRRIVKASPNSNTTMMLGSNRRPQSVEYAGGRERFEYDAGARLNLHVNEIGGGRFSTRYQYAQDGRLLKKWLPGGELLSFHYWSAPDRGAGLLKSIEMSRGDSRVTIVDDLNGPADGLNRRGFSLLQRARFEREVGVDGRLLKIGASGFWQSAFITPSASIAVDLRGGAPVAKGQIDARRYEWDDESRLAAVYERGVRIAAYSYDAAGQRISKTVLSDGRLITTRFLYEDDKLLAEIDQAGKVVKQYLWLDEQPVALIEEGRVLGIVADQAFAPRMLFDDARRLDAQRVTNLRASHRYFDAETGLEYNGRRYLDPASGRYLSADPLGIAGGMDPFAGISTTAADRVDLHGLQVQPVAQAEGSIESWSFQHKLGFIFEEAARQIQDHELAAALRELVSPQAIATTAIIFSTWAASQFTPYGWVGDLALTGIGALFIGKSIWDVIEATYGVAKALLTATCESDLLAASTTLARGLSQAAAAIAGAAATGAAVGSARIARLLRTVFRRDVSTLRRSSTLAAINQSRFGVFNPSRSAYSGRIANQEWIARQRANGRSDAHPPWDPAKSVVDTWLNPGQKIYVIQDRSAGPGGWATFKQYRSLEEARNELAVLNEFKRSDADLVLQEYTVTSAIPVREGFSGPQVSGWPASESYVGGGQQIQLLVDLRGANWENYLSPTGTIEFLK